MTRRIVVFAGLLAVVVGLLAACGDDGQQAPAPDPCALLERYPSARELRVPLPLAGPFFGQEVWISWWDENATGPGYRYPRTREQALIRARELCRAVHGGADIGEIALQYSNGDGGIAKGLVVVPEPSHRENPDARDLALFRTPVGELTPLLEWNGGFWFARRVTAATGRELTAVLKRARETRARCRLIHIHHKDAYPYRHEFDEFTKDDAVAKAWWLIARIQEGASFVDLAREHSNDNSRQRGGLQVTKDPVTGEPTEWIRWGDRNYTQTLLKVILEECPPGKLYAKPVEHARGVTVVQVLERKP